MRGSVRIFPSLMCADLCNLEREVAELEALGVEALHVDLMDARFVPNMPLGLATLEQLRSRTELPFDVHLMVEDNDFFVQRLGTIGVQSISVHVESAVHLDRTLAAIREQGARAGAALNPATPLTALEYVLERLDYVLIMTVNPGFAGQMLVPAAIRKIADCRAFLDARDSAIPIQVDGNVSFEHIPRMVAAGAEILVAGTSSLFHPATSRPKNFERMQRAIKEGVAISKGKVS